MRLALFSLLCAALLAAPVVRAEPRVVRLEYHAPGGCPSAAQFESAVRKLLPTLEVVHEGDPPRFEVEIDADGQSGSLTVAGGVRRTAGESCEEVANVLAFSVALAIDPNVHLPEEGPPSVSPSPSPASPSPAPRVGRTAAPLPPAVAHWGVGGFGQANSALAPRGVWGGGVAIDTFPELFGQERWFRFGLGRSWSLSPTVVDGARVSFSSWLLQLEGCPAWWRRARFRLGACVRLESGAKTAGALDIPRGHEETRPWLALGPMLRARARFLGPLFVDAGAGLSFPILRDRVFLRDISTVHQVPVLGGVAELVVGVEFGDRGRN